MCRECTYASLEDWASRFTVRNFQVRDDACFGTHFRMRSQDDQTHKEYIQRTKNSLCSRFHRSFLISSWVPGLEFRTFWTQRTACDASWRNIKMRELASSTHATLKTLELSNKYEESINCARRVAFCFRMSPRTDIWYCNKTDWLHNGCEWVAPRRHRLVIHFLWSCSFHFITYVCLISSGTSGSQRLERTHNLAGDERNTPEGCFTEGDFSVGCRTLVFVRGGT